MSELSSADTVMGVEIRQAAVTAERLRLLKQQANIFTRSQSFLDTLYSVLDEIDIPEEEIPDDLLEIKLHYAAGLTAAIEIFGIAVGQHEDDMAVSSHKYNKQVANLEDRNQTLRDDHAIRSASKDEQVANLEANIRAKMEEKIALQAAKEALENEVMELKNKLVDEETKHNVAIQAIKAAHPKADRKRPALTSQLKENTKAVQQPDSEAQTAVLKANTDTTDANFQTEDLDSLKAELAKLKLDVERLTANAHTVLLQAEKYAADAKLLTEDVARIDSKLAKSKSDVERVTSEGQTASLKAKISTTDAKIQTDNSNHIEAEISDLRANMEALTVNTEAIRNAAEKAKVDAEAKAQILESKVKAAGVRADAAEKEAIAAREQAEREVVELKTLVEKLTADAEAIRAAGKQVEIDAEAKTQDFNLKAKATKIRAETAEETARTAEEQAQAKIKSLETQSKAIKEDAKAAIEQAEARLLELRANVKTLTVDMEAARKAAEAAEAAEAEGKSSKEMLDEVKKELTAVVAEHKECAEVGRDSSLKLSQANKELRETQQRLSKSSSNFANLQREANKAAKETLAAREAADMAEADAKSSKRVLDEVKKDRAALVAEHKECRQVRRDSSMKLGQANKELGEAQQLLSITSSNFASLQREADELRKLLSVSQSNESHLQQPLKHTTGGVEQLGQTTASLQETRNDIGSRLENTELQRRLSETTANSEPTAEIDRLRAENASLRAQLNTDANAAPPEEVDKGDMDDAETKKLGNDASDAIYAKDASDDGLDEAIEEALADDLDNESSVQTTRVIPSGASSAFTFTHPDPAASSITSSAVRILGSINTAVTNPEGISNAADNGDTGSLIFGELLTLPPTTKQGHQFSPPQSFQQSETPECPRQSQVNPAPVRSGDDGDDLNESEFWGVREEEGDPNNGEFQFEGMAMPVSASTQHTPPLVQSLAKSNRNRSLANAVPRPLTTPDRRTPQDEQEDPAVPEAETATQRMASMTTNTRSEPMIQSGSLTASTGRSQSHLQEGALADWTAIFNTGRTSGTAEPAPGVRPAQFEVPRNPTRSDGTRVMLNPKSRKGPGSHDNEPPTAS